VLLGIRAIILGIDFGPYNIDKRGIVTSFEDNLLIAKTLGGILIILMVSLLVMLSAQETFKDILIPLGLYHLEQGIFTDCKLEENRNNRYCQPAQAPASKQWKGIKDGAAFDLSEGN
jgi:hypothetical protein